MPRQQELDQLQLDCKGLYTNPNDLSKVPIGSLTKAKNIVINRDGKADGRRGLKAYGTSFQSFGTVVDSGFVYQNHLIWHIDDTFIYDSDQLGTWIAYTGTFGIPSGAFAVHSVQSNKNIYWTTDSGIQKLDIYNGTIKAAGSPRGLDGSGTTTGASGWFEDQTQVAYRIIWGYVDANDNEILGAPSERIIVANNSGGSRNVSLTFTIPGVVTTSYFYQIYRSPMSVDLNTPPNDEEQLVIQDNPSGAEITAGTVTLTDAVPDELKGATIYTAESQQGISQSNFQPPIATDMALFKNFVFYANLTDRQFIDLTLLSVGAPNGLVVNDTITIDGDIYTAKAVENAAAAQFLVYSAGTPSENIDTTARSLVHVINTYSGNTDIYAYYVSGFNDLPGQIFLEERGIGGSPFTLSVSRPSAWFFSASTSTNDVAPAQIRIAKFQQPEAVPTVNNLGNIGSADKAILRILSLRNSVFIFKEDGVFRITGDDLTSFAVTPWDTTVNLKAPESAVLLNNQIYCFTTQGIIAVSETGSAIVSRPIERDLLEISASQFTNFDSVTFGIGYESEREYLLNTISSTTDTTSTQTPVYNYITNAFSNWEFSHSVTAGLVNSFDNKLYMASGDSSFPYIYQERKMFTETDFADDEFSVTITAFSGLTINVNDTTNLEVGDTFSQSFNATLITEIIDGTTITVADEIEWSLSSATVYRPILVEVEWTPIHGGNPTIMKIFKEILFFFSNPDFIELDMDISSDISPTTESQTLTLLSLTGYGTGTYGEGEYGVSLESTRPIRTWAPIEKIRSHWIILKISKNQALTSFSLNGVMINAQTLSYRIR